MKKLKKFIKKHKKLYVLARCFTRINDPNLYLLLQGYYENFDYLKSTIIHNANFDYGKPPLYSIDIGSDRACTMGFGALLRYTLVALYNSDCIGIQPFVKWGKYTLYYDENAEFEKENVFNYYYEPIPKLNVLNSNIKYIMDIKHGFSIKEKNENYRISDDEITALSLIYKKYIFLNKKTKEYLHLNLKKIFTSEKILGVHIRGTDFNVGYVTHPKTISVDVYIKTIKKFFSSGKYNKIFIATEDINLLDSFKEVFGNSLVYYDDVFRTSGKTGPHGTQNDRPLHHYKLGLEVLRDIYTLAYCDSLICGMSQVSFAARYINKALGRKYEEFFLIDNGINETGKAIRAFYNIKEKP